MLFHGLKIPVIILVFVVTLGAGVGAQQFFYRQQIVNPLTAEFQRVPGVKGATLEKRGGTTDVVIDIGVVDDLAQSYDALLTIAQDGLGDRLGEVRLADRRNAALSNAYYHLHFAIQEAIATGRFTELEQRAGEIAAQAGLDRQRIRITARYIAVQLHDGDHYLYEIVPRPATQGGVDS